MNSDSSVDPRFFLGSFLVVALHYLLLFVVLLMGMLALAWLFFPSVLELWTDPVDFEKHWNNTPELFWPLGMCVGLALLNALVSFLVGFQVAWFAPFSKTGHGIFLAIVCIVTFLQTTLTQPGIPKGMLVAMMITGPGLIVLGSRLGDAMSPASRTSEEYDDDQATH